MDYNHEQIQARILTARELRSRALGETLAGWRQTLARQLARGVAAIRASAEILSRRRSHS